LENIGLTGTIPSEIGNMEALGKCGRALPLCRWSSFTVPNIRATWSITVNAYLDFNQFLGPVPTEICSLPDLEDFRVDCSNECQCEACDGCG